MSCWTRSMIRVSFGVDFSNPEALAAALTDVGLYVHGSQAAITNAENIIARGEIRLALSTERPDIENEIKRAYAYRVVEQQSKKYGWMVKRDAKDPSKITVTR
jgi:hypothetical protein